MYLLAFVPSSFLNARRQLINPTRVVDDEADLVVALVHVVRYLDRPDRDLLRWHR